MAETGNEKRLDRIEEKIDKLSEAMIIIARAEEKLVAMESKYASQYDRLNRFSEKLDAIDKKVEDNARVVANIRMFFWVVSTAVVGALVAQYFKR